MKRVGLWRVVLGFAFALASVLLQSDAGRAQDQQPAQSYGPQLFLVSAGTGQGAALEALPLTVHGLLYGAEGPVRAIVSGGPELSAAAAAAGVPAELLDADTSAKAYYFVDPQAEGAAQLAGENGTVLYQDDAQILLAVAKSAEEAMLETLPSQGVSVQLLPPDGLPLPSEEQPSQAMSALAVEVADPAVQLLLDKVNPSDIQARIAQLSGVQPISTGGSNITLATRYTFASNVRTVEAAVFHQYELLGYAPSFSNWTYSPYAGRNVVAELRGQVHPERVWIVGGHFDSNSNVPYSSAPGADDNASGTAATLTIAGILNGERLADSVRFVQFGGEEQGKWGSISYARTLQASGYQVAGFIDLDMIGWDGNKDRTLEVHSGTRTNSIALAQRFIDANSRYAQGLRLEFKQASASRFSDHASFWDQGFASFMAIENFFDDAIPWDRNPYYHNTGDILSRVDLDYVTRTTRTALAMIAEGAGLLGNADPSTATPTSEWTPTRTSAPSPTRTLTATPPSGSCSELVNNGGFEATTAWSFGATATQAGYSSSQKHAGSRSVRLGIVPAGATGAAAGPAGAGAAVTGERNLLGEFAADGASYSSAYQTISVPASAARVTLKSWRRTGREGTGGDFQRALLLRPGTYSLITTILRELTIADWQEMSFDLTPYRGQSVVVYFEVYNDNTLAAPRAWMYIDDVSAQACQTGAPGGGTATPEPTPTATPIVTATSLATATPTKTPTPVATATNVAPATSTRTPTPVATVIATEPPPAACGDRVTNGGFEMTGGWTLAVTGNTGRYTTDNAHSGVRSVGLGVLPSGSAAGLGDDLVSPDNRVETNLLGELAIDGAAYSTAYQTISLPANAQTLKLSYWYWTGTEATSGNADFQRVLLLRPGTYALLKTLTKSLSNNGAWLRADFDLSAYAGQSVILYFEVYNDNISAAPRTRMYVDDVSVTTCVPSHLASSGSQLWLPLVVQ